MLKIKENLGISWDLESFDNWKVME